MPEDDSGDNDEEVSDDEDDDELRMNACLMLMTMWMASSFEDC